MIDDIINASICLVIFGILLGSIAFAITVGDCNGLRNKLNIGEQSYNTGQHWEGAYSFSRGCELKRVSN